jgi:hypothetical protein
MRSIVPILQYKPRTCYYYTIGMMRLIFSLLDIIQITSNFFIVIWLENKAMTINYIPYLQNKVTVSRTTTNTIIKSSCPAGTEKVVLNA